MSQMPNLPDFLLGYNRANPEMTRLPNFAISDDLLQSWVDGSFLGWLYYSRVENPDTLLILGVSSGRDAGVKFSRIPPDRRSSTSVLGSGT